MVIAVNTRLLIKNRLEGIGWFTFQTLRRMVVNHPEHQFLFIFDRSFDPEFIFSSNVAPLVLGPPTRHPFLWYFWLEWRLPALLKRYKADLFLSPDGFIPLHLKIPSITVIHDLNFEHRPADLPFWSVWYYRRFFPLFARKATRIATVSEYSKQDILSVYGIAPEKVDVVYNGSHERYQPLTTMAKETIKQKLTEGNEFFLFVGSMHPRKNIEGLLRGFEKFKSQTGLNFKLVIVGEIMFKGSSIERTLKRMTFREDIVFLGRKEPEELANIMGAAWALTFVPHFEGFGIPLLEAMHCHIPSVASEVTSIPEVAGDTAVYAQPEDDQSIALAMEKIALDHGFREQLIRNCEKRKQLFSWSETSDRLWQSVQKAGLVI